MPRLAGAPLGDDPVDAQGLGDDLADGHPRVERAVRILEDDLDPPPHRPQLDLSELRQVAALEDHLAAGRPLELEDAAARGRLAAAGLTHEPEGLAPANGEADAVHRLDHAGRAAEQAAADLEMLDEIAHLEDQLAGHAGTALPSSLATQHALRCSALTRSSGGTSARHRSMT